MIISGERHIRAPREQVWAALHDIDILRRTIPGCREIEQTGERTYVGSASVGFAAIKGVYSGSVTLLEENDPSSLKLVVEARSGHAQIKGDVSVELEPNDGGTLVRYTGDARVSGPIAVFGQRLLPSATRALSEEFFANLERELVDGAEEPKRR